MARLQRALASDGWLVVSPAEASAELFRPLLPVNFPGAILYRKEPSSVAPAPSRWAPETTLPALFGPLSCSHASDEVAPPQLPVRPPADEAETTAEETTPLERARALADQGKLNEARRLCEAALERHRLDPEAHLLLAAICQERGEIPAALEALRRALYLAPDSAPAHFLLGSLLHREGKRSRGRRSMETVVTLLDSVPRDEPLPGGCGLTAGRLLETARAYLETAP